MRAFVYGCEWSFLSLTAAAPADGWSDSFGNDQVFYLNNARLNPDANDPMVDRCTSALDSPTPSPCPRLTFIGNADECAQRGYDHAA